MKVQILSLILAAVSSAAAASVPLGKRGDLKFRLFYGKESTSEAHAREICECKGGELADVNINNIVYLTKKFSKIKKVPFAYVNSWNTDDYGCECVALFQGGTINVPLSKCGGPGAFICQFDVCNDHHRHPAPVPLPVEIDLTEIKL